MGVIGGNDAGRYAKRLRRLPAVALVGLVALLCGTAYYPFNWNPPRMVHNGVTRQADGALRFSEMNLAKTAGIPTWLDDARATRSIAIDLVVRPRWPESTQLASIMVLAEDVWHTDLAIAQERSDLRIWIGRVGSRDNGDVAFDVPAALKPQQWTRVQLHIGGANLEISIDGATEIKQTLPVEPLRTWGPGRLALGSEVNGGMSWQGEIGKAQVHTARHAVDYVAPGELTIPTRYRYLPDHLQPFSPAEETEWFAVLLHLVSFVPMGFLLVLARRPPMRPIAVVLTAFGIAVTLAAGKFLFDGRHAAVADIGAQVAGGLVGALCGRWLLRKGAASLLSIGEPMSFRRPAGQ